MASIRIATATTLTSIIASSKDQVEYGQVYSASNTYKGLTTNLQYIKSLDFIDEVVNTYTDEQREYYIQMFNSSVDKEYTLTNVINTYAVNENIVGIDVVYILSGKKASEITVFHKCFNFDLSEKSLIYLDALFDNRIYDMDLKNIDTTNCVFRNTDIVFYNGKNKEKKIMPYIALKNYNCSMLLKPENYGLNENDYNKLFGE